MPKISKLLVLSLITLTVTIGIGLLAYFDSLEKWHLKLTDSLYTRKEVSNDIVMVYIDDRSLSNATGLGKWQSWRRTYYAEVIKNLREKGAKVIGLDVIFTEKTKGINEEDLITILNKNDQNLKNNLKKYTEINHPDDIALSEEIKKTENLILGIIGKLDPTTNKYNQIPPSLIDTTSISIIQTNTHYYAYINTLEDDDEKIRNIPFKIYSAYEKKFIETMSVQAARLYLNASTITANQTKNNNYYNFSPSIQIPQKNGEFLINFSGPPYTFPHLSFIDVYNNNFNGKDVKNKIVLIGAESQLLQDNWPTPTTDNILMPGVEIQANAIQTIIDQNFLRDHSTRSQIILLSLLAIFAIIAFETLPPLLSLILIISAFPIYAICVKYFFNHGLILNTIYPNLSLIFSSSLMLIYKYFTEIKDRKQIKFAFSRYVNETIVDEVSKNPEKLKLGGEKREITVFFSDIADFTTLSEKMPAEELVPYLNEYFDAMTKIILNRGGTLDKYEGDSILAFWGAPLAQEQHANLACLTALEMRIALNELHKKWQSEEKPLIDFRIGINTGEMIVGNIGSENHFDYTVMGDAVNLGSRLESANKYYQTKIMISENTAQKTAPNFEMRHLDIIQVKGKSKPVKVYELLALKNTLDPKTQEFLSSYNQGIQTYLAQDFNTAKTHFEKALQINPNDPISQIYLTRCQALIDTPPQKDWNGTITLKTK